MYCNKVSESNINFNIRPIIFNAKLSANNGLVEISARETKPNKLDHKNAIFHDNTFQFLSFASVRSFNMIQSNGIMLLEI